MVEDGELDPWAGITSLEDSGVGAGQRSCPKELREKSPRNMAPSRFGGPVAAGGAA